MFPVGACQTLAAAPLVSLNRFIYRNKDSANQLSHHHRTSCPEGRIVHKFFDMTDTHPPTHTHTHTHTHTTPHQNSGYVPVCPTLPIVPTPSKSCIYPCIHRMVMWDFLIAFPQKWYIWRCALTVLNFRQS